MSIWIVVVSGLFLVSGLITIAACIASSRYDHADEILVEDRVEPANNLAFTPAPSDDL